MNKMKDLWDKLHPAYQGAIGAMILLFCIVPMIRVWIWWIVFVFGSTSL